MKIFSKPFFFLIALFSFITFFHSCKAQKQVQATDQPIDTLQQYVLKFERGPCFGQCPVYAFYLLEDHKGLVHSKANLMKEPGWYYTDLDQESVVEILELLEPPAWWSPALDDEPEIADLPSSSLVYIHPSGVRSISIKSRTNHSLETVFSKINHLVTEGRWLPTHIRPLEEIEEPVDLIVQLKDGVDIHQWMKKFERFGISLKKRITPRQQYYLVTRDPETGNANDFLQHVKLDPEVIDAEWDKTLTARRK